MRDLYFLVSYIPMMFTFLQVDIAFELRKKQVHVLKFEKICIN